MESSLPESASDPARPPLATSPERCAYCGAVLHSMFYFCLGCAMPYKDLELVLSPASPPVLGEGELIELKAPSAAPLFWTYFAVVVLAAIVSHALFQEERPDLALVLNEAAIGVTTCVFTVRHWPSLRMQLGRIGFDHAVAWAGLSALVPMLLVNYLYGWFLSKGLGAPNNLPLEKLREAGMSEGALVTLFCVLPAVLEEIAFRGLLQHWLQTAIRPWRALVAASFLFAVLHFSILSLPYLFAVGMLLGWVKARTASLYPSMLMHFLHNLAAIELIYRHR